MGYTSQDVNLNLALISIARFPVNSVVPYAAARCSRSRILFDVICTILYGLLVPQLNSGGRSPSWNRETLKEVHRQRMKQSRRGVAVSHNSVLQCSSSLSKNLQQALQLCSAPARSHQRSASNQPLVTLLRIARLAVAAAIPVLLRWGTWPQPPPLLSSYSCPFSGLLLYAAQLHLCRPVSAPGTTSLLL